MSFDNGTWWILAGAITIMVTIIGILIGLIMRSMVFNPIKQLSDSINKLIEQINTLNTFIELQKKENDDHKEDMNDIYEELDKHHKKLESHDAAINVLKQDFRTLNKRRSYEQQD